MRSFRISVWMLFTIQADIKDGIVTVLTNKTVGTSC